MSVNVDFSHFVISLAQGIMVGLGEIPDPETRVANHNLAMAKHSFGALKMLHEKTKGNLTDKEKSLIEALIKDISEKIEAAESI